MAKIIVSRLFDVALIASSKVFQDIEPFVTWTNEFSDNICRILTNGVSLLDNVDGQELSIDLKHNIPLEIATRKTTTPRAVYLARQSPIDPIVRFSWEPTGVGIRLLARFDTPGTQTINCTFYIHYS